MAAQAPEIAIRVAAVIRRGDEVLLAEHHKAGGRYFLLPGGGVQTGETLAEALGRELAEECGIAARVGDLRMVVDGIAPDDSRHLVHMIFEATAIGTTPADEPDGRFVGCVWAAIHDLETVPLRPPIAAELAALSRGGPEGAALRVYHGRSWTEAEEPVA